MPFTVYVGIWILGIDGPGSERAGRPRWLFDDQKVKEQAIA